MSRETFLGLSNTLHSIELRLIHAWQAPIS